MEKQLKLKSTAKKHLKTYRAYTAIYSLGQSW